MSARNDVNRIFAESEIEKLREENAKLHNRIGSLTLDNDLLRRGAADDVLTIHTCGEIIDRIKKENGDFRAKNSDLEKEVSKLRSQFELKDVQIRDLGGLVLELQQECCKFRALVERGASFGLDRCCCAGGFESCFSCACKEALK